MPCCMRRKRLKGEESVSSVASKSAEWRSHWPLAIAASLGYSVAMLHVYSFGPFISHLQQEFGWSRAESSMGIAIVGIGAAIFGLPMGILVDRLGPRRVGLAGALLMGITVCLLSTATGTIANWVALWTVIGFATLWVQTPVWTSAVASRFEASRGLAFAVTLSGASVGTALFPILATWLIGLYGWRTAFIALSTLWVGLSFPILFLFFRGARDVARKPDVSPDTQGGLTLAEGLRSPAFYKLLIAGGFYAFTAIGIVVHFVPILTDNGAEPLTAAGIAALVGVFSIIGRLGTGALLDRFPAHVVGAGAFLIPLVACLLLLFDGESRASQAAAAAFFGLTVGAEVDVIAYLATRHFGLEHFGALFGALVTALALGTALGPLAAGATFDRYESYAPFLVLTMVLMASSSVALATLSRPPFGARH